MEERSRLTLCIHNQDNVFQIVAPRSYVHNSLLKLYDSGRAIALPIYDPFGALA